MLLFNMKRGLIFLPSSSSVGQVRPPTLANHPAVYFEIVFSLRLKYLVYLKPPQAPTKETLGTRHCSMNRNTCFCKSIVCDTFCCNTSFLLLSYICELSSTTLLWLQRKPVIFSIKMLAFVLLLKTYVPFSICMLQTNFLIRN